MSERERWIVYPLLFFALGAALRDKFTQQVRTDRLDAGQIACEELTCKAVNVRDPLNPTRPLAILTSTTATYPDKSTRRLGSLLLSDSEGQELFWVVDDQLRMRQIICEGIVLVDPKDPSRSRVLKAPSRTQANPPRRAGEGADATRKRSAP